jgi:hypothetical protein
MTGFFKNFRDGPIGPKSFILWALKILELLSDYFASSRSNPAQNDSLPSPVNIAISFSSFYSNC